MATHGTYEMLAFFTGMPGWAELLVVAFIGLLLFGKRLPDVARSLGTSIVEFKKGMRDVKNDIDNASNGSNRSLDDSRPAPLPRSSDPAETPSDEPAKSSANPSE